MERKGFTLIELIFVIVIIGVLAAVAVPKFQNLKQNAEANNVYKVLTDGAFSVPSSYSNLVDLEEKYSDANVTLKDLVQIQGKDWSYAAGTVNTENAGTYTFAQSGNTVATLRLDITNHQVVYSLTCANFTDTKTQKKCSKILGDKNELKDETVSW